MSVFLKKMMQSQQKKTLAAIVIIAAIAVSGFLILVNLLRKTPESPGEGRTIPEESTSNYLDKLNFPPPPPEQDIVYSYTGTITSVSSIGPDQNILTIDTERGIKKITWNSQTEIVSQIRPTKDERDQMTSAQLAAALNREYAFTDSFTVGMLIRAVSDSNIRGFEEFTASKIIVTK